MKRKLKDRQEEEKVTGEGESANKRIHPFFKPEEEKKDMGLRWLQQIPSVLIARSKQYEPGRSNKIAAFDLVIYIYISIEIIDFLGKTNELIRWFILISWCVEMITILYIKYIG